MRSVYEKECEPGQPGQYKDQVMGWMTQAEATDFGLLQSIQTGSGAHPTTTKWILGCFPWK